MPALSPTMEKGSLATWLVREGNSVKAGDVLAEIETDKASMELEAVHDGIVSRIVVAAGTDDVPVGTVIALIGDGTDETTGEVADRLSDVSQDVAGPLSAADPLPNPAPPDVAGRAMPAGTKVSPLARRLAAAEGIDLAQIRGSGRDGKILRADLGLPERTGTLVSAAPAAIQTLAATLIYPPPDGIPHEALKLSGMRKTIAKRLTESKQTVPHFYLSVDVRLDALLKLRGDFNAARGGREGKLSVNDFLIKAFAVALEQTPDANVQFGGDRLYRFQRVDISVAIAIPGGLVTPVVVDAGNKRLTRIAAAVRDFAVRAHAGKLAPEELLGGTASLSNLGMFGMKSIIPVINPPQAVTLGIGIGEERPWVVEGQVAVAALMTVTASFDHRAIDGAAGAELVRTFKDLVEQPTDMLV